MIWIKLVLSAAVIAISSELAKVSNFWASMVISLPLVTILSFCWTYFETADTQKIIDLSYNVFYLVIPSLAFFLILPLLLKHGIKFPLALFLSCGATAGGYYIYIFALGKMGIRLQ